MPATVATFSPWGKQAAPLKRMAQPANDERSARTCANRGPEGSCLVCGATEDGYFVEPAVRCPQWRGRTSVTG